MNGNFNHYPNGRGSCKGWSRRCDHHRYTETMCECGEHTNGPCPECAAENTVGKCDHCGALGAPLQGDHGWYCSEKCLTASEGRYFCNGFGRPSHTTTTPGTHVEDGQATLSFCADCLETLCADVDHIIANYQSEVAR